VALQPQRQLGGVRHDEEEAPQAVDDRWDRGHQVDQRDQGGLEAGWGVLGDVEGGEQRQGERQEHRHQGDLDRAEQDRRDAQHVGLGLPLRLGEEAPPVVAQGRERLPAEEEADAAGDQQHGGADDPEGVGEHRVTAGRSAGDPARRDLVTLGGRAGVGESSHLGELFCAARDG